MLQISLTRVILARSTIVIQAAVVLVLINCNVIRVAEAIHVLVIQAVDLDVNC
ncbi:hypothetical protein ACMG4J_22690 [Rossellomorea marisflavi]|uniref:hypothetical protein n=1 Tax=Rossellomorea marisflavi TaxID=189381 RepID=UPI0039BF97FA